MDRYTEKFEDLLNFLFDAYNIALKFCIPLSLLFALMVIALPTAIVLWTGITFILYVAIVIVKTKQ